MKKAMLRIILVIIIVWAAIAAADFIFTNTLGRPIFCVPIAGGDMVDYIGAGYSITVLYPLTSSGQAAVRYQYFYWPYLIITAILIAMLIFGTLKNKQAIRKTLRNGTSKEE